ncbi:MAG: HigA family addiction module antitoxin [Alphaproteobacteria bacterium]|nr:HigA family addiction module antitoxin [Alphaproteobacteria bacterium]
MFPVHPGGTLRDELEARALTIKSIAGSIGVPVGRVADIVNERRAITPDTALRLARFFGNGADFWIGLQAQYDVAKTRKALGKRLDREVRPLRQAA